MYMTQVHAVTGPKGGPGKTTTTIHLSAVTAQTSKVLVTSTDPQGNLEEWVSFANDRFIKECERQGVSPSEGEDNDLPFDTFELIDPSTMQVRFDLLPVLIEQGYDHIFIDTPGSFESAANVTRTLDVVDDVVLVMDEGPESRTPTARAVDLVERKGIPYKILVNKWNRQKSGGKADGPIDTWRWIDERGWPRCSTAVKYLQIHPNSYEEGRPCTQYRNSKTGLLAREDYYKVALELYGGGRG